MLSTDESVLHADDADRVWCVDGLLGLDDGWLGRCGAVPGRVAGVECEGGRPPGRVVAGLVVPAAGRDVVLDGRVAVLAGLDVGRETVVGREVVGRGLLAGRGALGRRALDAAAS